MDFWSFLLCCHIIKMVVHICKKCGKNFNKKSQWDYHVNKRKKHCDGIAKYNEKNVLLTKKCEYCMKMFSTKPNLKKHLGRCKTKKEIDSHEISECMLQIKNMRKEIEKLKKMPRQIVKNKIDKQINNNNNLTINNIPALVPNGKEDLSFLTKKDYIEIFKKGWRSVPTLIKKIHLNYKKKEYQNIRITNKKGTILHTFNGKCWNTEKCIPFVDNLVDESSFHLFSEFDGIDINEIKKEMTNKEKFQLDKFIEFRNEYGGLDKKCTPKCKKEMKIIRWDLIFDFCDFIKKQGIGRLKLVKE
jgi:hypothetical protein